MNDGITNKAELVLALLYGVDGQEIEGITRLEKLLFLLKIEKGFLKNVEQKDDFHFFPFKMGPWTNEVYDEIDFLESLGLLQRKETKNDNPVDDAYVDELFTNTMLDKYQKSEGFASKHTSEVFRLSEPGKQKAKQIWSKLTENEKNQIIELKSKFNKMDLKQFLRYIYQRFPEYTTKSEIKDALGI